MKKFTYFLASVALCFSTVVATAQTHEIYNSSFEELAFSPNHWDTTHIDTTALWWGSSMATISMQAHTGNRSMHLSSWLGCGMSNGSISQVSSMVVDRPEAVSFWYKRPEAFNLPNSWDSTSISQSGMYFVLYNVIATGFGPDDFIVDTVGIAHASFGNSEEWVLVTVPITYLSNESPNEMQILFTASEGYNECNVWIDDVNLVSSGGRIITASIAEDNAASKVMMYPNPATDHVYFDNLGEDVEIKLIDMTGKIVRHTIQKSINISNLASGSYQVLLHDKKTNTLSTIPLIKQ